MGRFTIRTRLVVGVLALLAVAMGSLVTLLTVRATTSQRDISLKYGEQLSQVGAAGVRDHLVPPLDTAHDLAAAFAALAQRAPSRAAADEILHQVVAGNPEYLGAWAVWEPGAFDSQDAKYRGAEDSDPSGRYAPYWYRDAGALKLTAVEHFTEPGAGDFYLVPLHSGKEKVLEPYLYEISGKQRLLTTVSVPIRIGSTVMGVAGVDLALDTLQSSVTSVRPFDTGRTTLVSTAGALVAGGSGESIGKAAGGAVGKLAGQAARQGRTVRSTTGSGGSRQVLVAAPVRLGDVDTWSLVTAVPESTVLAPVARMRDQAVLLTMLALAVSAAAALLLGGAVVGPLRRLRDRMVDIADGEGDLTQRVDEDNVTEVGQLGAAYNRFVAKVAATVHGIAEVADALAGASQRVDEVSGRIADSAGESAERAAKVADAAQDVSRNVQTVASGAEEMGGSIREISLSATEAAHIAQTAVSVARTASETVGQLHASGEQIAEVLDSIASIAAQTNLLALNATIEAARAGDSGKGFAVVAGEVKDLAQETARSAEDISHRVEAITADTTAAVRTIEQISAVIDRINDYSTTIAGAVEEQTATTQEIARSVADAAAGSVEIAHVISGVAGAADVTTAGARDAQQAAGRLSELSSSLRSLVGSFRV